MHNSHLVLHKEALKQHFNTLNNRKLIKYLIKIIKFAGHKWPCRTEWVKISPCVSVCVCGV